MNPREYLFGIACTSGPGVEAPANSSRVLLLPMGVFEARGHGLTILLADAQHAADVVTRTRLALGRTDLLIDYDHHSTIDRRDFKVLAAGWAKPDSIVADDAGIWADVEWTPGAEAHRENREYRYISPYFAFEKATGRVTRLISAGMVNQPAIEELPAIAAAQGAASEPDLEVIANDPLAALSAIAVKLNLPADASPAYILNRIDSLNIAMDHWTEEAAAAKAKLTSDYVPLATFEAVSAELLAARQGVAEETAVRLVEAEIAAGHLIPAMRDWAVGLCTANRPAFEGFVERTAGGLQHLFTNTVRGSPPSAAKTPLDDEIARNLGHR